VKEEIMSGSTLSETPRVETRGPITVAGIARTYRCDGPNDIPAQWQKLGPHIGRVPKQMGSAAYGVGSGMIGNRESYQYLAGVAVTDTVALPEGFTSVVIPERTYAVFIHRGRAQDTPQSMGAILSEHLPRLGLKPDGDMIESYDERFDPVSGRGEIEIWILVRQ
jgi:AraC family transcriptional regulator